jgi:Transposase IS4
MDPADLLPFVFQPKSIPGCQGVEITAVSVFKKFMNEEIIDMIVNGSNEYSLSQRYMEKFAKRKKRDGTWNKVITGNDIYIWLAVTILTAIHNKQQLKDCWAKDDFLATPIFAKIMSRDRYFYIRQVLHVSISADANTEDPLWKCRKFITVLNENYQKSYTLGASISVNESLQLYRGHHSLIHFVPNKAARFGFKQYVLAESDSGYVWRFFYDMGPKTKLLANCPPDFNKPDKIVWTLLASEPSVLGEGRVLGVDNYYTSINLFYELSKYKTDAIGTVRKNCKGLPHSIRKHKWNKAEKGNILLRFCDSFLL